MVVRAIGICSRGSKRGNKLCSRLHMTRHSKKPLAEKDGSPERQDEDHGTTEKLAKGRQQLWSSVAALHASGHNGH